MTDERNGEVPAREDRVRDHSLDELAKGLANRSLSRGDALKWAGAAIVGGLLAAIPGVALADPKPPGQRGKPPGQRGGGGGGGGGEPGACAHDLCVEGEALDANCDPCVQQICAVDTFCCNNSWDATCVGEVSSVCGCQTC